MKDKELTPDDAAQIFMKQVIDRVYGESLRTVRSQLEDPKLLKKSPKSDVQLFEWYANLDTESRKIFWKIIQKTISSTIFGFLVLLDNAVNAPLPNQPSDFAIYLQAYKSWEDMGKNLPSMQVRFNSPFARNDLHDMLYDELSKENTSEWHLYS